MEWIVNPWLFGVTTAVLAFGAYWLALTVLMWTMGEPRLQSRTVLALSAGVVIAATIAVEIHMIMVHQEMRSGKLMQMCAEEPECAEVVREIGRE